MKQIQHMMINMEELEGRAEVFEINGLAALRVEMKDVEEKILMPLALLPTSEGPTLTFYGKRNSVPFLDNILQKLQYYYGTNSDGTKLKWLKNAKEVYIDMATDSNSSDEFLLPLDKEGLIKDFDAISHMDFKQSKVGRLNTTNAGEYNLIIS